MTSGREKFDSIVPTGDLSEIYEALNSGEVVSLPEERLAAAHELAKKRLKLMHESGKRLLVMFQADNNVYEKDLYMGDFVHMDYKHPVKDAMIDPEYRMLYGEVDDYRLEDIQSPEGETRVFLVAEVTGDSSEFDVYMAGTTDMSASRTKLHQVEDISHVGPEIDQQTHAWEEYVEMFREWLEFEDEDSYVSGQGLLEGMKDLIRHGMIRADELTECVTALNLALAGGGDFQVKVKINGAIFLTNPQIGAALSQRPMIVEDECMALKAIDLRWVKGQVYGELYCFDEKSWGIAGIPLDQEGVQLSLSSDDINAEDSDS